MNKDYINTIVNIYSDEKSNDNLNFLLNEKKDINKQLNLLKKIFMNFTLFIYFIIVCYFCANFIDNFIYNEKLDYLEGILLFLSLVSILFLFVINDFFKWIISKVYQFHYNSLIKDFINKEKNEAILDLVEKLKMTANFNLKTKIETTLQDIQDKNPDTLKDFYNNHEFKDKEIKNYIYFLIEQSKVEEDF